MADSWLKVLENLQHQYSCLPKSLEKRVENDGIRTPCQPILAHMLVNFTTMKTKKLNITQIPHISAHFNPYHVKEHQKLSCKLSSLILCGLVFSCNLQKCCKNPKYTISTETQNSSSFMH